MRLEEIDMNAGKECHKTRTFLQYFILATQTEAQLSSLEQTKTELRPVIPNTDLVEAAMARGFTQTQAEEIAKYRTEFPFTIQDVDSSEDNLDKTEAMLSFTLKNLLLKDIGTEFRSRYTSWGTPDDGHVSKLLSRLPFPFLHDLIRSAMKHTNYRPDLLELKSFSDSLYIRDLTVKLKWEFIDMIKQAVSYDMRLEIDMDVAKVCAGKECHKTRTFLQYFILATINEARSELVRKGRREWLRAIWRNDFHPGLAASPKKEEEKTSLSVTEQLMQFFTTFPGLRQLIGGVMTLYFDPPGPKVMGV